MSVAANLSQIQEEIANACRRANRQKQDVALMAVSKMHPAAAVREAFEAGQRLFGENRVQEWQEKSAELADLLEPAAIEHWRNGSELARVHLIGPLQSNKTAKAAELFHAVDAVDSTRIASRLNAAAAALQKKLPVLIEVKLSHEETKHGVPPSDLSVLLAAMTELENLVPCGLMTVPPWSEDAETARPYFRELRKMRDEWVTRYPTLTELSMGMSNDFRVAIEEGSTCVRIGTAIFGKRQYPVRAPSE